MKFLQALVSPVIKLGEWLSNYLLLAVRVIWGLLFIFPGWSKLIDIKGTAVGFAKLGIPYPEISAYLAGGAEFFGGILLVAGLFSRIVSIPLIFTMIVAYATAHADAFSKLSENPEAVFQEHPFNFLMASLLVLCFGPGKFSLDSAFGIEKGK
ncbi:MAG: DoxX family protein [Parachlamydiaceae bacterium]